MENLLITGGAGFIGSNFLHYMVRKYPDKHFVNVDALTYAGSYDTVEELEGLPNYTFINEDICSKEKICRNRTPVRNLLSLKSLGSNFHDFIHASNNDFVPSTLDRKKASEFSMLRSTCVSAAKFTTVSIPYPSIISCIFSLLQMSSFIKV